MSELKFKLVKSTDDKKSIEVIASDYVEMYNDNFVLIGNPVEVSVILSKSDVNDLIKKLTDYYNIL